MRYLSHVDEYRTLKYKYKYKYKYFKMVLEYYSSTSTSTKYYISADLSLMLRTCCGELFANLLRTCYGETGVMDFGL